MNNQIKCPHCNLTFEPTDAYKHELEEKFLKEAEKKYSQELKKLKEEQKRSEEEREKELLEVKKSALVKARIEAEEKLAQKMTDQEEQISSLKERAEKAEKEELSVRKEKRDLEEQKRKFELEKERQLDAEREKIREKAVEELQEIDKLKFAEYEKKISDMNKALQEAERKGKQGSQELQGAVLEADIEEMLQAAFPDDSIVAIGKGQQGGDIIQKVKGKSGRLAGVILWETKRAKWQKSWIKKLKEDARKEGATVSVLLSINLPGEITDFQLTEGVVVCSYKYALSLATILRRSVLHIAFAKQTAENKDENLEMLYQYIQSEPFRHRFESFAEGITEMQNDLDYEKRAMERVWKKREVQIKKTLINASRMYGELQGVMGNALPDIKTLTLPGGEREEIQGEL